MDQLRLDGGLGEPPTILNVGYQLAPDQMSINLELNMGSPTLLLALI